MYKAFRQINVAREHLNPPQSAIFSHRTKQKLLQNRKFQLPSRLLPTNQHCAIIVTRNSTSAHFDETALIWAQAYTGCCNYRPKNLYVIPAAENFKAKFFQHTGIY